MPKTTTPKKPRSTDEDFVAEYERKRSVYSAFTDKLKALLGDLLTSAEIKYHTIESRTKEIKSFRDKITRSNKAYIEPLNEVTDLSGLRVIVYYLEDVDAVCDLIKREFSIDETFSIDKGELLKPNEFGYRSVHYVIALQQNRRELLEWRTFAGLAAEVQVRTVLQHAWASISHTLDYKRESEAPSPLRRKLSRLAGLLELSDEEFSDLRQKELVVSGKIVQELGRGEIDVELNTVSLVNYLKDSALMHRIERVAREAGFDFYVDEETFSELISFCHDFRILTIKQLDEQVAASQSWIPSYLNDQFRRNAGGWDVDIPFLIELILIARYSNEVTLEYLVKRGWGKSIAQRVLEVAKKSQATVLHT